MQSNESENESAAPPPPVLLTEDNEPSMESSSSSDSVPFCMTRFYRVLVIIGLIVTLVVFILMFVFNSSLSPQDILLIVFVGVDLLVFLIMLLG